MLYTVFFFTYWHSCFTLTNGIQGHMWISGIARPANASQVDCHDSELVLQTFSQPSYLVFLHPQWGRARPFPQHAVPLFELNMVA